MKPSDILAQIRHLACLGLPSEIVIPPILELFDKVVLSKNSDFVWTDSQGRIANFYARHVDPVSLDIMLHHKDVLARPGELSFEMHSCSMLMTGNLDKFRAWGNLERTVTYNEIWTPNALEQFLDLVVRDDSGPRALFTVGRSRGDLPFSEQDTRRIVATRPWILHALDTPPREQLTSVETGEEAVILCDRQGRVVQLGPNAQKLLLYAGNGQITAGAVVAGAGDAMPGTVRNTCANLAKILAGRPADPPQARLTTAFGAFNFRAHPLSYGVAEPGAEELLAVVIRRESPLPLTLFKRTLDLPLTPRQQEIAVQIGLGKSPERIQSDLDLSAGTYRRHVEDIHVRLDVRSRAQLMATLMARPTLQ